MPDLSTRHLGQDLSHPLVVSAGPLSRSLDAVRRAEDAGTAMIVMHSLFEEQILHESRELDHYLNRGADVFAEASDYFPDLSLYNLDTDSYVNHVRQCVDAVSIPVVASLNGVSKGGWTRWAAELEQAGAAALELNLYRLPTDLDVSGSTIEEEMLDLVASVRSRVSIPLSVKLSPYVTSLPHLASRLTAAGADSLVLFNRFYQPDLDPDTFEVVPSLALSRSEEMRLPLRWTAILHGRVDCEIALSGGVHGSRDAIKALMAGATVVQMTSGLLLKGLGLLGIMRRELEQWLSTHEYENVAQLRGCMSHRWARHPDAWERANYMKVLQSFDPNLVG